MAATNDIRLLRNVNTLAGTCYFEVLPGPYKQRCWNSGSVFFDEEVFGYLEPIIAAHCPGFDHYGFAEIPKAHWLSAVADLERLMDELAVAESVTTLRGRVGFTFEGSEERFAGDFERSRTALQQVITEFVGWLRWVLEEHDTVSVLGL